MCVLTWHIYRYVVTTMTLEKDVGIENLARVIESIRAKITASEGRLEVKMAPKAVSQRDEADLQVRLLADLVYLPGCVCVCVCVCVTGLLA